MSKFKPIEVNDPVKVKVLNYWVQGTVESMDNGKAVVKVPAYYGYASEFLVDAEVKSLKPILLKEDKK